MKRVNQVAADPKLARDEIWCKRHSKHKPQYRITELFSSSSTRSGIKIGDRPLIDVPNTGNAENIFWCNRCGS